MSKKILRFLPIFFLIFLYGCSSPSDNYISEYTDIMEEGYECILDVMEDEDEPWELSREEKRALTMATNACVNEQTKQMAKVNRKYKNDLKASDKSEIAKWMGTGLKEIERKWQKKLNDLTNEYKEECYKELGKGAIECRNI